MTKIKKFLKFTRFSEINCLGPADISQNVYETEKFLFGLTKK